MEYYQNETSTPCFGNYQNDKNLLDKLLRKRIPKSNNTLSQYVKNKEKYEKKEKSKEKSKEKNKSKSKSKEKSKSKYKSSKSKKNKNFGKSLPIEHKYENPLDIFLKKKIVLRNDFDQNNSEKFLSEKELAFHQFRMDEDADYLED